MDEKTKQLILDYQHLFDSARGLRVLDDLKSRFDVRILPMGMPDVTAFQVGQRETYLYIMDKFTADPDVEVQDVAETYDAAN